MDRTERFYTIERLLRTGRTVPFEALQAALGVSRATLNRDLQYLRDRLGAPIAHDRETGGYRLHTDPVDPATSTHELPGLWFSENELHALLSMHQLLAGLDDGGVLSRHLQPLVARLQGLLGPDDGDALLRRVKLISTARRRAPNAHFELLGSALVRRRRVRLRYFKRTDRSRRERDVSPQRLVHYRNTWYLDAWCHASDGLRRFALDAVEAAQALDDDAVVVPVSELEAALDAGYGIYGSSAADRHWATLRFAADAAQWVAHEEWHPDQTGAWLPDGSYELKVPYTDARELSMDILRHGDTVQVLGDTTLIDSIAGRLHRAAALYPAPAAPAPATAHRPPLPQETT